MLRRARRRQSDDLTCKAMDKFSVDMQIKSEEVLSGAASCNGMELKGNALE